MKMQSMPNTNLIVSRIAFGCMRLPADRAAAVAIIKTALDLGINFFDHADVYQHGRAEHTFSTVWEEAPHLRQQIVLQTKCGICPSDASGPVRPARYDFSYDHIIESVEGSLQRLKTDYVDILLLHRPDPLVDPEDVARAFSRLQREGKVRYFGVSNHTGPQIDLLKRYLTVPLVANQLEISVLHNTLFNAGIITNQDHPLYPVRGEGTMEYCRLHDITVQAWGPLATGKLTGKPVDAADERMVKAVQVVAEIAAERNVSTEAVLTAWILKHPARIQPIIGTMNAERLKGCCQALSFELTREDWYRLFSAGRGAPVP
jgi:predicted oxidoreductase